MSRNVGIPGVVPPKIKPEDCQDQSCPFHGNTRIRGKITQGIVVSKKSKNFSFFFFDLAWEKTWNPIRSW